MNQPNKDWIAKYNTHLLVNYKDQVIGEYITDILIANRVIVELKAVNKLLPINEAQLLNYLKVTNIGLGLLVNFTHPKAAVKRYVSG